LWIENFLFGTEVAVGTRVSLAVGVSVYSGSERRWL
jgi:hypothetical protein